MTIDEHMGLKGLIMRVRDELIVPAKRNERLKRSLADLEYCLTVLNRRSVLRALTSEVEMIDEEP